MHQLSTAIRRFREKQGWSKAELGRRLGGISGQLIGQYEKEKGAKIPGSDFIIKWKEVFGSDLLQTETNVSNKQPESESEEKENIRNLSLALKNLSEDKVRTIALMERMFAYIERTNSGTTSIVPATPAATASQAGDQTFGDFELDKAVHGHETNIAQKTGK